MKNTKRAIIVVDLGYGDAGKGSMVDYYTRLHNAHTVVRFNGGAQAAHNVVLPNGTHHMFNMFGSGTLAGARTFLSKHVLVDPSVIDLEVKRLEKIGIINPLSLMAIDGNCPIVTPYHLALNRIREISRGSNCHGSCGMGISEIMMDIVANKPVLKAINLYDKKLTEKILREIQDDKLAEAKKLVDNLGAKDVEGSAGFLYIDAAYMASKYQDFTKKVRIVSPWELKADSGFNPLKENGTIIFEGAQGVLLDEWHGFHPYTTWSTTTFENADSLLAECGYDGRVSKIGVTRGYMARHGPGPFPSEDAKLARTVNEPHNKANPWQKDFRVGWIDFPVLDYARKMCGKLDGLAVTCVDHLRGMEKIPCVWKYNEFGLDVPAHDPKQRNLAHQQGLTVAFMNAKPVYSSWRSTSFLEAIGTRLDTQVVSVSQGPTYAHKYECGPTTF